MKILKMLSASILALILSACTTLNTKVITDANVNPDINGEASPVAVNVFELTDPISFEAADFLPLYTESQQVLGSSLLYEKTFVVSPGVTTTLHVPYVKGARFLGFVAAFRNLNGVTWQVVTPVNPSPLLGQSFTLNVNSSGLSVSTSQ